MSKKIEKLLASCIIAFAAVLASVYLYIAIMGQAMLTRKLAAMTQRKVSIGHFSVTPGLTFQIRDLSIDNLARFKDVVVAPSITGFLRKKLIINKLILVEPEFFFNKVPPKVTDTQSSTVTIVPETVKPAVKQEKKDYLPFGINRLIIKNGKLTFVDQTVMSGSIKILVKDISADLKNFYLFPVSALTEFRLKASIPWRDNEAQGKVELDGWFNSFKRDIRATLKISDIDAVYLYPYYSYWVDLDKARIEKARLRLTSEIHGLNNDVTADCHLELVDMVRRPLEIGQSAEKASRLTDAVLDRFKALDNGRVELKFAIKTKMDSPQFGFDNFKMAFEDKIVKGSSATGFKFQDMVVFPVKMAENGLKSFTDLGRAMVDGVFAIGYEIGKLGSEALKKDPAEAKLQ